MPWHHMLFYSVVKQLQRFLSRHGCGVPLAGEGTLERYFTIVKERTRGVLFQSEV